MRRAAHQLFDSDPVFLDPLALPIIGPDLREELQLQAEEEKHSPLARGMRTFFAVRSRVAEDALAVAVERGLRQYVVLGAGLDTFAYRNPFPDLQVFEVDFPATQEWKREQLQQSGISCPPNLTFASIDFERQTLAEGLDAAGLDQGEATIFSCLGVIPYLTEEAVARTFSFAGSFPSGSGMIFDYVIPPEHTSPVERSAFDVLAARVAAAGEPFRFFSTPEALAERLRGAGFNEIMDLDSEAINARYLPEGTDRTPLRGSAGHIMSAWVR